MISNKLAAFGKTGETKSDTKYPELTDATLSKVATNLLVDMTKYKALETVITEAKALLTTAAKAKWLEFNSDRSNEYSSSVVVVTDRTKIANNVIVSFTEGYQVKEKKEEITEALGPVFFSEAFDDVFSLSVDSTKIPRDAQEGFVDGLIELCAKFGINPAEAIKAKNGVKPKPEFNPRRMRELTPAQNLVLDAIYPVPSSVSEHKKTKGDENKVRAPKK